MSRFRHAGGSGKDEDAIGTVDKLNFSDLKVYGRSVEVSELLDAFHRVRDPNNKKSEMVLISGYAGTGKTTVANELRQPVRRAGGYFVSGKFDQRQRGEPYTAFVVALDELCNAILDNNDETALSQTRQAVKEAVGSEGKLLVGLIPKLQQIVGKQLDQVVQVSYKEAGIRFNFIFRKFIRAVCTDSHPLALYLENLHWADEASLDLITTLMTDTENTNLLLVACFRDNEVNHNHPLTAALRIVDEDEITVTKIKIGNLNSQDLNSLIFDQLGLSDPEVAKPLSDLVHQKTKGNVFFAIQFLKSLVDEGLLWYCFGMMRWRWDEKKIEAKQVTDNVVDLMMEKIRTLPFDAQEILEISACLGSSFDLFLLETVTVCLKSSGLETPEENRDDSIHKQEITASSLDQVLDSVVNEGLLDRDATGRHFRFSHDQIQRAASSLVPDHEQGLFQLHVGQIMLRRFSPEEIDKFIFHVVDLLNEGVGHLSDVTKRIELAGLNMRAGERAISLSAFKPAAQYLKAGINLLGKNHWQDHYDLTLNLYSFAAGAEYCNGNFDEMDNYMNPVLVHAKSIHDKFPVYYTLIRSLGARYKSQECLDVAFKVLAQLGERFPKFVRRHVIMNELVKTKFLLKGHSESDLSSLPLMTNVQKFMATQIITTMVCQAYFAGSEYWPLILLRSVQLSVRYGVCKLSALTFPAYGTFLCGYLGDFKGGFRYGLVGLSLLERFKAKELQARVSTRLHTFISHWTQPAHLSLRPTVDAYRVGMEYGDIENALWNIIQYCVLSVNTGQPLLPLESNMNAFCQQMAQYKHHYFLTEMLLIRQMTQNLMGLSRDRLLLTGEGVDQDQTLNYALKNKVMLLVHTINGYRMWLAYYFSEYELAGEIAGKSRGYAKYFGPHHATWRRAFIEGLTAFALARRNKKTQKKWVRRGRKVKKKMKMWIKAGNVNSLHMLALLEAEDAAIMGKENLAHEKFKSAVTLATRHGFLNDSALANERAGTFFWESGDSYWASHYLDQACKCYCEWGAQAIADHLLSKYSALFSPEMIPKSATLCPGKSSRFPRGVAPVESGKSLSK